MFRGIYNEKQVHPDDLQQVLKRGNIKIQNNKLKLSS
jgi:hypothetical protein